MNATGCDWIRGRGYLFPLARLWVLQSIWQLSMLLWPPLLQAVTWSASISLRDQSFCLGVSIVASGGQIKPTALQVVKEIKKRHYRPPRKGRWQWRCDGERLGKRKILVISSSVFSVPGFNRQRH